ncbi:glutamate--cysteine ligase [Phaeovulum vinaykumarii]|uniref:Glutamate--cysteine ligase n=1 Tax=Phaeovulum vinaykumarii TaxID=407234 RepID=A0A1N7JS96_9RHOB|nr:glutamate--cysteine ligase [Phaeovulum vinaykumarii]SIS52096.1 glutamate--cysteine ligase [Phaeovulum vinaykumarii]SOB91077.1 glutamate--cysteine ligase [Phaeovulum vinaykumarii]
MSIPQEGGGPIEDQAQLAEFLAAGEKPRDDWRIGTEHERFGYLTATGAPLPYEGPSSVRALLEGLRDRFGWTEIREAGALIGLKRNGANISLEPGGQVELSGAPLPDVHAAVAETRDYLDELAAVAAPMGVSFASLGAAPVWRHEDMPMMPKGRYRLMTGYMGKVGQLGTQMMYRTCTVQVNLDFASEADMVKKLRVALSLQPVATALFANSPFLEGRETGLKSWRSRIWRDLDAARTGMLPFVFEPGFGYQAYVDYVLDVPMYFVHRDGRYIDALGQSFRDFLEGKLPALPGERPTLSDWADHLTTVFPEARLKQYLEMRGADAGSTAHLGALPALWVGLLYDQGALDAAWDLVKGWDHETRQGLRVAASEHALQGEAGGVKLGALAREVVALARAGLEARGLGEERHLAVLEADAAAGEVQADRLLAQARGPWAGDLSRALAAAAD